MSTPRLTKVDLWRKIHALYDRGQTFCSLVRGNKYKIVELDEAREQYRINYESGRKKWVPLYELCALYCELYKTGMLPRNLMRNPENSRRIVGRKYWHAPGATVYAILPVLDDSIRISAGGDLSVLSS